MTKEKAIETFKGINELESIALFFQPGSKAGKLTIHGIKEASRMAIAALRSQQIPVKLDRSRWKGCKYCLSWEDLMTLTFYIPDEAEIREDSAWFRWNAEPQYCPICGKPLTEEAWEKLEQIL